MRNPLGLPVSQEMLPALERATLQKPAKIPVLQVDESSECVGVKGYVFVLAVWVLMRAERTLGTEATGRVAAKH